MPIYSDVDCTEVYDTRRENYDAIAGQTASVTLQVSKLLKDALVIDLIDNRREAPWIAGSNIPTVKSVGVVPITTGDNPASDQGYEYEEYYVNVQYAQRSGSVIVVEEIEPVAEFIRLDHRFFRWSSDDPLTEGEAPAILYQSLNLVFKYVNQGAVPSEVISGVGYVHNASWTSPTTGLVFPSETLLFCPGPLSNTYYTTGSTGFSYSTKFSYRPNGWNKVWRPKNQAWESVYLASTGAQYKSYPAADLSALLP